MHAQKLLQIAFLIQGHLQNTTIIDYSLLYREETNCLLISNSTERLRQRPVLSRTISAIRTDHK